MARNYTKIIAWQRAHRLAVEVYRISRDFPQTEIYGLTSQLRRASYGVAANIVEGTGRDSKREYLHFLSIAAASLRETEYFLLLARDLGYLSEDQHRAAQASVNEVFAPLHGLATAVRHEVGIVSAALALITSSVTLAVGRLYAGLA